MEFDPQEYKVHRIVASMRLPGPDYLEVLSWLHQEQKPASYVEIGVGNGSSLELARPPTVALGIDPVSDLHCQWQTDTHVASMTSREFFANHKLREFLGMDHFSLAFIDGAHLFEEVIAEILQLERLSTPSSLIAVHDTIPLDAETASRKRSTLFYTGDVWKINPFLKQHRPDLERVTVRAGPSGLTLIRRLDALRASETDWAVALDSYIEQPWTDYDRHCDAFLETIANRRHTVLDWLGQPANVNGRN